MLLLPLFAYMAPGVAVAHVADSGWVMDGTADSGADYVPDASNVNDDDIIVPSTKLDNDPWPITTGSVVPKGDLTGVYTGSSLGGDNHIYLYNFKRSVRREALKLQG